MGPLSVDNGKLLSGIYSIKSRWKSSIKKLNLWLTAPKGATPVN